MKKVTDLTEHHKSSDMKNNPNFQGEQTTNLSDSNYFEVFGGLQSIPTVRETSDLHRARVYSMLPHPLQVFWDSFLSVKWWTA